MSWLSIIILVLILWRMARGAHRGLIKELISFIGMIFLGTAIGLLVHLAQGYFEGNIVQMVLTIVLISVLAVLHSLIKIIIFPAKVIAKIPIVSSVDKMCGILFGALEIVIGFWILCIFIQGDDLGAIGNMVLIEIEKIPTLMQLREMNLIVWVVDWTKDYVIQMIASL